MKTVLNLVLSCETPPYDVMVQTSLDTWDSIDVEGCETIFYFGASVKESGGKFVYLPVAESLGTMGQKLILALEWALENKEFNYLARPHSCIYVNKKELVKYIQDLPCENVFAGIGVDANPKWMWGGTGYVLSKDVVRKIVDNKKYFRYDLMEDMGLSYMINDLSIPYTEGRGCSIDNLGNVWRLMVYGGGNSFEFTDFADLKKLENQFFFRCKQDQKRWVDKFLMEELFKILQ